MSLSRPTAVITLDGARQLADAALAEAVRRQWTVAVAIVNPEGGLVLFHCLDGTQPASQDLAILKARTAARFKRPTKAMEDAIATRPALGTLPDVLLLEGGVPITVGGQMIGAIGISGMSSAEDGVVAAAALATI
jgi:uncharacterized protein GlcG (DUF336 family)